MAYLKKGFSNLKGAYRRMRVFIFASIFIFIIFNEILWAKEYQVGAHLGFIFWEKSNRKEIDSRLNGPFMGFEINFLNYKKLIFPLCLEYFRGEETIEKFSTLSFYIYPQYQFNPKKKHFYCGFGGGIVRGRLSLPSPYPLSPLDGEWLFFLIGGGMKWQISANLILDFELSHRMVLFGFGKEEHSTNSYTPVLKLIYFWSEEK